MANCNGGSKSGSCVECDVPQLARNHFFTGKLLVERDFTDEQRYFMGKERRHNQRLHGSGIVCGLKVVEHPTPACRDQYVMIEPGTAIDCCGREILVEHDEQFDFKARFLELWQEQHGQNAQPDDKAHLLQICIRYAECPTEEVPALFDDCGCDDTACQPNRILEKYDFDLLIDPTPEVEDPIGVSVKWDGSHKIAHAYRVAAIDAGPGKQYVFILTSGDPAVLYVLDAINGSTLASATFNGNTALDLAASPKGDWVYVALQPTAASTDPNILVIKADKPADPPVNTLAVTGGAGGDVRLALTADGRLWATNPPQNQVLVWATDINKNPPAPAGPQTVDVKKAAALAANRDGSWVYVASPDDSSITAIKADLTKEVITVPAAGGAKPSALAVATTADGDNLAIVDSAAGKLYLVGWRPGATPNTVFLGDPVTGFAHRPVDVRMSLGGNWAYVLEQDDTDKKAYVQPVDAHRVQLKLHNPLGTPVLVGTTPQGMFLTDDSRRLYVAYDGDGAADTGQVAIVDVSEEPCADLFTNTLDGCPDCAVPGCLVLATVAAYTFGDSLTTANLDNLRNRKILPSTEVITDVVKCLLERGGGGGERGPEGQPGQDGLGIDSVTANFVDCTVTSPPQPTLSGSSPNRTLTLTIPRGCDGPAGKSIDAADADLKPCGYPGPYVELVPIGGTQQKLLFHIPTSCEQGLTHICTINWQHGEQIGGQDLLKQLTLEGFEGFGFVIVFDNEVLTDNINRHTFQVLVDNKSDDTICWCDVRPMYVGGAVIKSKMIEGGRCSFDGIVRDVGAFPPKLNSNTFVNGALFLIAADRMRRLLDGASGLRIMLKGDLIKDKAGKGVDANHLPDWLPKRATGDGVEGGTFESSIDIIKQG